ncbi:MAG: hypothetical protein ACOCSE_01440 [Chitinivibrionales bacterium]
MAIERDEILRFSRHASTMPPCGIRRRTLCAYLRCWYTSAPAAGKELFEAPYLRC